MKKLTRLNRFRTLIGLMIICLVMSYAGIVSVHIEVAHAQQIADKPPLTIITEGGAATKTQMLALIRPYRKLKNRWVNVELHTEDGRLEQVREQVMSFNVKWDVVVLTLADVIVAHNEGLLERIDHNILAPAPDGTRSDMDFYEGALREDAVGFVIESLVVAYNPDKYKGNYPAKLADFFDLEKFPGLRGLQKKPEGNLEWALLADGVSPDQVYKMLSTKSGLKRAFRILNRIKPNIVWWESGSDPAQLLSKGKIAMSSAWNGRIYSAVKHEGNNFKIIWDRQIWQLGYYVIPRGSDNLKKAMDYISFATEPKHLAALTRYIADAPARKSAMQFVTDEVRHHLPTDAANKKNAFRTDHKWWAENYEKIEEQFTKWLEKREVYDFDASDRQ